MKCNHIFYLHTLSDSVNSPYRKDLIITNDGLPVRSILVDTQSKLDFDPITLQWTDSLKVTINPFQWNSFKIEFQITENITWDHLKNWFSNSFTVKNHSDVFKSTAHFISDPYEENNLQIIDFDLGSGTVDDFVSLLDTLSNMGLSIVTLK